MKALPPHSIVQEIFNYDDYDLVWRSSHRHGLIGKIAGAVHRNGYRQIKIKGSYFLAHRLVWLYVTGNDPGNSFIDHIDCNRLNNQLSNLRLANKSQNQANMRGVKGVYRIGSKSRPWQAFYRGKYLGRFSEEAEAKDAYMAAYEAHSGIWARKDRLSAAPLEDSRLLLTR
jgi:hypothetical protein